MTVMNVLFALVLLSYMALAPVAGKEHHHAGESMSVEVKRNLLDGEEKVNNVFGGIFTARTGETPTRAPTVSAATIRGGRKSRKASPERTGKRTGGKGDSTTQKSPKRKSRTVTSPTLKPVAARPTTGRPEVPTKAPVSSPERSPARKSKKEPGPGGRKAKKDRTVAKSPKKKTRTRSGSNTTPVVMPSSIPSDIPSEIPSSSPSKSPVPTITASSEPSSIPSDIPSAKPSPAPSAQPSDVPSVSPSEKPSSEPSVSSQPSSSPSTSPTAKPTRAPTTKAPSHPPSRSPTKNLTLAPTTKAPTTSNYVGMVAMYGGDEFVDPESYQSKALRATETWANTQSGGRRLAVSAEQVQQYYSLACFYYATYEVENHWTKNGEWKGAIYPWKITTNWLVGADPCTWYGITCNGQGRVSSISMTDNNISGYIPMEISYLKDTLLELDLTYNWFEALGDKGTEWIGTLENLETLVLDDCYIEYYSGIPPSIASLTKLKYLSLSYTAIEASPDFGLVNGTVLNNLRDLYYVDLSYNYMNVLPANLFANNPIETLLVYDSDVQGTLDFIKSLSTLVYFEAFDNPDLSGAIPTEVGTMVSLEVFDVANCGLTGSIPSQFEKCVDLSELYLFGNKFSGGIPPGLAKLGKLEVLSLENNPNLSGDMPSAICDMKGKAALDFLTADCQAVTGKVSCTCCDCCGPTCNDA